LLGCGGLGRHRIQLRIQFTDGSLQFTTEHVFLPDCPVNISEYGIPRRPKAEIIPLK
jgi:hypothetical protein